MIAAIVQARTSSTRLPLKVLKKIEGEPLLLHVIERISQAKKIDKIVVATTNKKNDKEIVKIAKAAKVEIFTGSEDDVLDRFYQAAKKINADIIVRVTGDCPFIDPEIIDGTINFFKKNNFDYVSTGHIAEQNRESKYPDGLDTEVFSFYALKKAWRGAKFISEREHVTPYIWKNKNLFKITAIDNDQDLSFMRWTVDEKQDLKFVKEVYKRLYSKSDKKVFLMKDILNLLKKEPNLMNINNNIVRDEGYLKSLADDKK